MELDFKTLITRLDNLQNQVDDLKGQLGRTARMESGSGGVASVAVTAPINNSGSPTAPNIGLAASGVSAGSYTNAAFTVLADGRIAVAANGTAPVTSVGATSPIASSGGATPNISLAATTSNDGGTVVKQAGTGLPGTSQTGSARVSGSVAADTAFYRNGIAMNNVTVMDRVCRILDDTTSRASGYSNSAVQVTGVLDLIVGAGGFTMPATIKAVWFNFFVITAAAGTAVRAIVENPTPALQAGAYTFQAQTSSIPSIIGYAGGGVVSLNASGQLRYLLAGGANITRTIIDIWAYLV